MRVWFGKNECGLGLVLWGVPEIDFMKLATMLVGLYIFHVPWKVNL